MEKEDEFVKKAEDAHLFEQSLTEDGFIMKINKNGHLNVYIVVNKKIMLLKKHVGEFDNLLNFAKSKSYRIDNEQRRTSEIIRKYLYFKTIDQDDTLSFSGEDIEDRINSVDFINDYKALIRFCFESVGKAANKVALVTNNNLFSVSQKCFVYTCQLINF